MYLIYANSRMEINHLCLSFGIIPSTCSIIIDDMMGRRTEILWTPHGVIKFPTKEEMKLIAARVQIREPSVDNVIGFVDGVSLTSSFKDGPYSRRAVRRLAPNLKKQLLDQANVYTSLRRKRMGN